MGRSVRVLGSLWIVVWLGCAATPSVDGGGGVGTAGSGGSGGSGGAGGSGVAGASGFSGFGGFGGGSGVGSGGFGGSGLVGACADGSSPMPEQCNRQDTDCNGIVDDLDVDMDGVCDCLTVATIGAPGGAGQGNVFNAWLQARSAQGATDLGSAPITATALAPFQVLVIQNVEGRVFSSDEVQALETWVRGGGGLMTLIGYSGANEANSVNTLLASFGLSYGTQDVMQAECTPTAIPFVCGPRQSRAVTEWQPHPISFGITQVGMDNGKPVLGSGTVVATGEGHNLAIAVEPDAGKVFVWGDEWITFDSDWAGRPEFQVEAFWLNALKWLTPTTQCQVPLPPPPE